MTTRQLIGTPETLSDMDQACNDRLREGEMLLNAGMFDGAIYLMGYAVEIRLKLAAFRVLGCRPYDQASLQRRRVASWMRQNAENVPFESGHSLFYWSTFLELHPRSINATSTPSIKRGLRRHVLVNVYQQWKVDMRYRVTGRTEEEAFKVWTGVRWTEEHWTQF